MDCPRKGSKLAIPVLEELVPPRETSQASAPCEPPVEAGHVCDLRSDILYYCRGTAGMVDGSGIGPLGDSTNWGLYHLGNSPKVCFRFHVINYVSHTCHDSVYGFILELF